MLTLNLEVLIRSLNGNGPRMGQEGIEEVRTGRSFVLTKYELVSSHPVRNNFRSTWDFRLV